MQFYHQPADPPRDWPRSQVGTSEFPDGWAIDGGWYEIKAKGPKGPVNRIGAYMLLARKQADNSWKIHWSVNNGGPAPVE